MSDIQYLIELLKSDDPNKRYDACEELRVSRQPLQQEAINALKFATNDSNSDVADAAQRALALHAPQSTSEEVDVEEQERDNTIKKTVKNWQQIGILVGIFTGLFFTGLSFINTSSLYGPFVSIVCFSPAGILFGIIGALLGNRSKTAALIAAFLIALSGVGFLYYLFNFTCLFCI